MTKTVVGKGNWRISFDEDGEITAIELWYANVKSKMSYTYDVLDIKSRGGGRLT